MPEKIAGFGGKRPQLNVPLGYLELDNNNPRLPEEYQGGTQFDVLKILYRDFDLETIAYSMAENGYFDEEPIVAALSKSPKTFKWTEDNVVVTQNELSNLIEKNEKNLKFTVVEGNRRVASAILLIYPDARMKLKVDDDFPKPKNKQVKKDLQVIPSIVYKDRKDISPYLGVRHIIGVLKWEAYAKAKYIAKRIEEEKTRGKNIEDSIKEIQKNVADRSDVIKKQYMYYKILEQARDDLNFDIKNIIDRFSLIGLALGYSSVRDFIGVPSHKEADFNKPFVSQKKLERLAKLLSWIFGKGKDEKVMIKDSRLIGSKLAPILADDKATKHLLKYENLDEAYERSGGDREFLMKKINQAHHNIEHALTVAYKFKNDEEIRDLLKELVDIIKKLEKDITEK